MTQRSIEIVVGRLLTDEEFRQRFVENPERTLRDLSEAGTELTRHEIVALLSMDPNLWVRGAARIDDRLQKASLKASSSHARSDGRGDE